MKRAFFSKFNAFFWVALLLCADIAFKESALRFIPHLRLERGYPFGGIGLFKQFGVSGSLNTIFNTGAAWGLFADYSAILLAVRICFVLGLLIYLLRASKTPWLLWTILAGALGNILDMLRFGYVVDFIHLQFFGWSFPIFNLADCCISLSVALLLIWPKGARLLEGSRT